MRIDRSYHRYNVPVAHQALHLRGCFTGEADIHAENFYTVQVQPWHVFFDQLRDLGRAAKAGQTY